MKNGLDLYKRIAERKTASQRWNDLTDEERTVYTRLAEGIIALVKLHDINERELAKYLMQYTTITPTINRED